MDEKLMEDLARAAGLDRALAEHRADLAVAFAQVASQRKALGDTLSPADEPWPPMQVRDGR